MHKKEKHKKNLNSFEVRYNEKEKFKDRLKRNSFQKITNIASKLNKDKKKQKVIYENKGIVINDITKNYGKNKKIENFPEKVKTNIINKISKEPNISKPNNKIKRNNTDANNFFNKKNLQTVRDSFKFNFEMKNDRLNSKELSKSKNNKTSNKESKEKLLKNSFNDKILEHIEKKKIAKNIIIQNRIKNINYGDSYEFNFTFNNFNSNYTYNNLNNTGKDSGKSTKKIAIKTIPSENIISEFKLVNPSSVKNNILGGIHKIFKNNNEIKDNIKKEKSEKQFRFIRQKDKEYYATKIQRFFRGYLFRKNYRFNLNCNKTNTNFGIYIKKKVLVNNRNGRLSSNNTSKNLYYNSNISKIRENYLSNNNSENRIEEIIISKSKMLSVLYPAKKRIDMKDNETAKNRTYERIFFKRNFHNKNNLLKFFNHWKDTLYKKIVISKLINYIKIKRNNRQLYYNVDCNDKFKNEKRSYYNRYQKKCLFRNNTCI